MNFSEEYVERLLIRISISYSRNNNKKRVKFISKGMEVYQ